MIMSSWKKLSLTADFCICFQIGMACDRNPSWSPSPTCCGTASDASWRGATRRTRGASSASWWRCSSCAPRPCCRWSRCSGSASPTRPSRSLHSCWSWMKTSARSQSLISTTSATESSTTQTGMRKFTFPFSLLYRLFVQKCTIRLLASRAIKTVNYLNMVWFKIIKLSRGTFSKQQCGLGGGGGGGGEGALPVWPEICAMYSKTGLWVYDIP